MTMLQTVLGEAQHLVLDGDRRKQYGHPVVAHRKIAAVWTAMFGREFTAADVALALAAVKLVREAHKHSDDNLVDLAGYTLVASLATEAEKPGERS